MAEDHLDKSIHGSFYGSLDAIQKAITAPIPKSLAGVFRLKVYDKSMLGGRTLDLKPPVEFRGPAADGSYTLSDSGGRDVFFLEDGTWSGFGARAPLHQEMTQKFTAERDEQLKWSRMFARSI